MDLFASLFFLSRCGLEPWNFSLSFPDCCIFLPPPPVLKWGNIETRSSFFFLFPLPLEVVVVEETYLLFSLFFFFFPPLSYCRCRFSSTCLEKRMRFVWSSPPPFFPLGLIYRQGSRASPLFSFFSFFFFLLRLGLLEPSFFIRVRRKDFPKPLFFFSFLEEYEARGFPFLSPPPIEIVVTFFSIVRESNNSFFAPPISPPFLGAMSPSPQRKMDPDYSFDVEDGKSTSSFLSPWSIEGEKWWMFLFPPPSFFPLVQEGLSLFFLSRWPVFFFKCGEGFSRFFLRRRGIMAWGISLSLFARWNLLPWVLGFRKEEYPPPSFFSRCWSISENPFFSQRPFLRGFLWLMKRVRVPLPFFFFAVAASSQR